MAVWRAVLWAQVVVVWQGWDRGRRLVGSSVPPSAVGMMWSTSVARPVQWGEWRRPYGSVTHVPPPAGRGEGGGGVKPSHWWLAFARICFLSLLQCLGSCWCRLEVSHGMPLW